MTVCRLVGPQPNVAIRGSSGGCAKEPSCRGHGASCLGGEERCMGGSMDKALLGTKGQGSGRGYVDFLPARRWWQEDSCGVLLAMVPSYPSMG